MMRWEAEQKGYTCNDCFLAMQNCHDMSICCEDETGLCDWFEEIEEEGERMNDCMEFPDTVEEFMEQYKVVDTEQVYTNGTELVPIFRMKQWFEHLPSAQPEIIHCKECKYGVQDEDERWYCRGFGCQVGEEDGSGFCADAERRTDDT